MENCLNFHHIGIACRDIEATKPFYIAQGYVASETVVDSVQSVNVCFLDKDGMPRIELLSPIGEDSPVARTLEASGVAPYHICYEVDDMTEAIKGLKSQHFILLKKPVPACAIGSRAVCFLYSKNVGLVELVEK